MNELQETIVKAAIPPGVIKDSAAFVSNVIDKLDFPGCSYLEFQGVIGVTDIAMTTLKVMESDTKTDAVTLGGSPVLVKDSTTKPSDADSGKTFTFGIDLTKSRQRYLQLQATAGNGAAGTYLSANVVGYRPSSASSRAADRGLLFAEYA